MEEIADYFKEIQKKNSYITKYGIEYINNTRRKIKGEIMKLETIDHYLNLVTKDELAGILKLDAKMVKKAKKEEFVEVYKKNYGKSKKVILNLIKTFPNTFIVHPSKLEEELGITKAERKLWTEEGKLKVHRYESFSKWGKTLEYPLYSLYELLKLTDKNLESWRIQHSKQVGINRCEAVKKAVQTKEKHKSLQRGFYENEWVNILKKWNSIDTELSATLDLAYWTVWISRWAKEKQVKSIAAKTKQTEYNIKKEMYYQLKNESIELLSRSPFAKLTFYEPESSHKISNVELCSKHYDDWCESREFEYIPIWQYFNWNQKEIKNCDNCSFNEQKHFYSLYYLSIHDESFPDVNFSFHTPYSIGSTFLPCKSELPKVKHQEQEGIFRFGRTITDEERIIFTEKETLRRFRDAKEHFTALKK